MKGEVRNKTSMKKRNPKPPRQDTAFPSPPLLGPTLVQDFPEVELATRLRKVGSVLVRYGDRITEEPNVYSTDTDFFKVFSFMLEHGDPERALAKPKSVIITRSTADKYFGDQDPMGKILTIEDYACTVTGIAEDVDRNSHFHYDFLVSITTYPGFRRDQWIYGFCATYIVLREGASPGALTSQFPAFVKKYLFDGGDSAGIFKNMEWIGSQYKSMRTALQQHPDVVTVSATSSLPGREFAKWSVMPQNVPEGIVLEMVECDYDFLRLLRLKMAEGRFFPGIFKQMPRRSSLMRKQRHNWDGRILSGNGSL